MRKIILTIALVFLSGLAFAGPTIVFDPSPSEGVDGYRLYWRTAGQAEFTQVDIGLKTQYQPEQAFWAEGETYNFYATAYCDDCYSGEPGESTPSDTLIYTYTGAPQNIRILLPPKITIELKR